MKAVVFTLVFCLGFLGSSYGQKEKDQSKKAIAYKAIVLTTDGNKEKGVLFYADSTGILITDGYKVTKKELIKIPYTDIESMKLHREGDKLKGAIIGGAIGLGLSLLITKDAKDIPANFFVKARLKEDIIAETIFSFTTTGIWIGAKLSDKRAKFTILGNKYAFLNQLNLIKDYCFVHDQPEIDPQQ